MFVSRLLPACILVVAACATSTSTSSTTVGTGASVTVQGQPAAGGDQHHHHMPGVPPVNIPAGSLITEADVRFMQGMIAHHAQAIHMSKMAVSHGANSRLVRFAQKIDMSQDAEIELMQRWLAEYKQFVPDASSWRTMSMPGMLTAADMAQLEAARGKEFDRLFLQFMIQHHEGALQMVEDLLKTPRAAQEVDINVFANEVVSVQTAEIAAMLQMLDEL